MKAVVTRVSRASVTVDGAAVAAIGTGLLVLVGVAPTDTAGDARTLARRIATLRILRGERALVDEPGFAALVVSQFTLLADTRKGRRPSWSAAASGAIAEPLVNLVAASLRELGITTATGRFGADMQVESVNDGPVTILLEIPTPADARNPG